MANFVSWAVEYQRAKDALANRAWESYFLSSVENHQQMRTTYTMLGNITSYIEWLRMMADNEAAQIDSGISGTAGGMQFIVGGG
jgi:hypothetical protein